MQDANDKKYFFGEYEIDTARRLLLKDGEPIHLKSKAFELLITLVEHSGEILSKNDLLDMVWENQFVEENNLTVHIAALRKALGERKGEHRLILTVPGQGYRFVGELNGHNGSGNGKVVPPTLSAQPQRTAEDIVFTQPGNKRLVFGVTAILVLAAAVSGLYLRYGRSQAVRAASQPFNSISIRRLTTDGRSTNTAISPDGKLFVYSHDDGELQSLWLGHVDGGEPKPLMPPAALRYYAVRFSPDASSIYFGSGEEGHRATYKMPVFGGAPEKVADDAYVITFAPDGKRFAYVKRDPASKKATLVTTDALGKSTVELSTPPEGTDFIDQSVAWSPDGQTIAVGISHPETDTDCNIFTIDVADGSARQLTDQLWTGIGAMAWTANGSGLIANALKLDSNRRQLWYVSYPEGEVRHVVSDLNIYGAVSMAAGQNLIATVQAQALSNVWVAPAGELGAAKQVTVGSIGRRDGTFGVDWSGDGRIIYTANIDGGNSIWTMNADGSEQKQLIPAEGNSIYPSVSADSGQLAFDSNRSGNYAVWIASLDGGDLRQLTGKGVAGQPHISPDGKWVVYISNFEDSGDLWRISTAGGEPAKVADHASWPRVSPDSQYVACGYSVDGEKIAIFSIDGGEPLKIFDVTRNANLRFGIRWTPDGKAVTYRDWVNGIWQQNLAGGEPQRIKGLPAEKLYSYDWSSDGKKFAFARGNETRDVVLIASSN